MGLDLWAMGRGDMDERELAVAVARYAEAGRVARRAWWRAWLRNRAVGALVGAALLLLAAVPIGILRGARWWGLGLLELGWVLALARAARTWTTARAVAVRWAIDERHTRFEAETARRTEAALREELARREVRVR